MNKLTALIICLVFLSPAQADTSEKKTSRWSRCCSYPGCCSSNARKANYQLLGYKNQKGETRYKLVAATGKSQAVAQTPSTNTRAR